MKHVPVSRQVEEVEQKFDGKTEFVNESTEFGKEVNRRLTERGISIYEQIGILRKAIKSLGCTDAEFLAFDALVEEIKGEIRAEENEHPNNQ